MEGVGVPPEGKVYDVKKIGTAKRRYDTFTDMYQNGQLSEKQFKYNVTYYYCFYLEKMPI